MQRIHQLACACAALSLVACSGGSGSSNTSSAADSTAAQTEAQEQTAPSATPSGAVPEQNVPQGELASIECSYVPNPAIDLEMYDDALEETNYGMTYNKLYFVYDAQGRQSQTICYFGTPTVYSKSDAESGQLGKKVTTTYGIFNDITRPVSKLIEQPSNPDGTGGWMRFELTQSTYDDMGRETTRTIYGYDEPADVAGPEFDWRNGVWGKAYEMEYEYDGYFMTRERNKTFGTEKRMTATEETSFSSEGEPLLRIVSDIPSEEIQYAKEKHTFFWDDASQAWTLSEVTVFHYTEFEFCTEEVTYSIVEEADGLVHKPMKRIEHTTGRDEFQEVCNIYNSVDDEMQLQYKIIKDWNGRGTLERVSKIYMPGTPDEVEFETKVYTHAPFVEE